MEKRALKKVPQSDEIRNAIIRLICYADLYEFPLTIKEIMNDLPWENISESSVKSLIDDLTSEFPIEITDGEYLNLKGKKYLVEVRKHRKKNSQSIYNKYRRQIRLISSLPYVRTIALTGAMAFENSSENDDIDLFLIVQSNRLWLVDLYNLIVFRLWNEKILRRRRTICVNYIVEDVSLRLSERDFFTAHQIHHMKPLYDEGCWEDFIDANDWVREFFPSHVKQEVRISKAPFGKRMFEFIADYLGIGFLNILLYAIRGTRLKRKKRLGQLKGSYGYRHLKANDSRRGAIAIERLNCLIERHFSGLNGVGSECLVKDIFKKDGDIVNCLNPDEEKSIRGFLDYYKNHLDPNVTPMDEEVILKLPFAPKDFDKYAIWKRRAKNFNRVMGLIRTLEPSENSPVLDLGAGNCWLTRWLVEDGYHTVACDACSEKPSGLNAAEIFQSRLDLKFKKYQCLMENLPFKDNSFKGVVASASFHYSPNPQIVLTEIYRILKNDGWAIIFDSPVFKNKPDGDFILMKNKIKYDPDNSLEKIVYKPKWYILLDEFISLCQSVGFNVKIIPTRNLLQKLCDSIINRILSRHKWAEFPILLLTKKAFFKGSSSNLIKKWRYYYFRLFVEGKLKSGKTFNVDGIKLKVPQGVFHPIPFDSSRILLRAIGIRYKSLVGKTVLDMGTGSGVHAIACSKLGGMVTAVDINPKAIQAAKFNSKLNGVGNIIDFFESDLFDNLKGKAFDLVIFNPPFYEGAAKDLADKSWIDCDNQTLKRFLSVLGKHLNPNGEALVILSNRMDTDAITTYCDLLNLSIIEVLNKRVFDEVYTVFSIKPR